MNSFTLGKLADTHIQGLVDRADESAQGSPSHFARHDPATQTSLPLAQEERDAAGPTMSMTKINARLSGKTRLFLAGNTLSMLGTGLVLPFIIIYLHQSRGIVLPEVGEMLAAGAATGLVVVMACGALMDRVGARWCSVGSCLVKSSRRLRWPGPTTR